MRGGRFRTALRGQDPRDPLDPEDHLRCSFLLEFETPIEVEHFDPQKPLYYHTFQKLDVQKHKVFHEFVSDLVQKHKGNVTFSKNEPKPSGKPMFLVKMHDFHCTVVLSGPKCLIFIALSYFFASRGQAWALGPTKSNLARAPRPMGVHGFPMRTTDSDTAAAPNYIHKLPIHRHRAALLVRNAM